MRTARHARLPCSAWPRADSGSCPFHQPRKAFSLIELLVVIAIVVLLIGMLAAVLGKARKASTDVQCLSHLRQIMEASLIYATESKDFLPFPNSMNREIGTPPMWAGPGWLYINPYKNQPEHVQAGTLWNYLRKMEIYRCPMDVGPWTLGPTQALSSYMMSTAVRGFADELPSLPLGRFRGEGICFWEGRGAEDGGDVFDWNDGNNDPPQSITGRHKGGGSLACFDGHCEEMSKELFDAEIEKSPGRLWCSPLTADGH